MEALDLKRKAYRQLIARVFGSDSRSPRYRAGQLQATGEHADMVALPQRIVESSQNLDTGSTDFGTFYFMVDYDGADSYVIR